MISNIHKIEKNGNINIIKFERTALNISELSTKSISEIKIQETSTIQILKCLLRKNITNHNCSYKENENNKDLKIEANKRFWMPIFIPLIGLIACFLLSGRKEKKFSSFQKYIYFFIGFFILICSEITVRYSGTSLNHTTIYYLIPIILLPLVYIFLIRAFKYENLN